MRTTRREALLACAGGAAGLLRAAQPSSRVRMHRVPAGGIQPQVVAGPDRVLHVVYYTGDGREGLLHYASSKDGGATFSKAIAVNTPKDAAIAAGTIRGAQLALGKDGRVHVAWNGAANNGPLNPDSGKPGMPMLYTRLNHSRTAFDAPRNLMHHSFGLDGGGTLAADAQGNVHVMWHGIGEKEAKSGEGEARRRVWLTSSQDEGRTFSPEHKVFGQNTGACGCCGMKLFSDSKGRLIGLYRSARESVHRDVYLLSSADKGQTFNGRLLHQWDINACPMTSMDIAESGDLTLAAWETGGQVFWSRIDAAKGTAATPVAAPGEAKLRKHPRLAINNGGEALLVWTEGTGWQKGGSYAWQLYSKDGRALERGSTAPGIPVWSFAAPLARPDGSFSILL